MLAGLIVLFRASLFRVAFSPGCHACVQRVEPCCGVVVASCAAHLWRAVSRYARFLMYRGVHLCAATLKSPTDGVLGEELPTSARLLHVIAQQVFAVPADRVRPWQLMIRSQPISKSS